MFKVQLPQWLHSGGSCLNAKYQTMVEGSCSEKKNTSRIREQTTPKSLVTLGLTDENSFKTLNEHRNLSFEQMPVGTKSWRSLELTFKLRGPKLEKKIFYSNGANQDKNHFFQKKLEMEEKSLDRTRTRIDF
jgi:hypothetical protein